MDPYQDPTWIPIWILYGSLLDFIWVVYMQMCSQLIQNVNISFEICTNVLGGLWEAAGALRGRFGEGSGVVRGRFGGGSGAVLGRFGEATGEPAPDPPVGILYGTLIVPLLEPSSELAIKEYFI